MDERIISRIRKLIALAESTHSEEEARTAAREAVRLIAKHGLLTGQPTHAPPPPRPKAAPVWNGPVTCKSSWTGTCEVCGKALRGSGIVYWQGKRVRHAACHRFAQGGRQ